jgi:hypothetical protein
VSTPTSHQPVRGQLSLPFLKRPRRASNVAPPGGGEVQGRLFVGECRHHTRTPPDFAQKAPERIVNWHDERCLVRLVEAGLALTYGSTIRDEGGHQEHARWADGDEITLSRGRRSTNMASTSMRADELLD